MVAVTATGVRTAIRNSHRQGFLRFVDLTMRARLSIPHIPVDVKGQGGGPHACQLRSLFIIIRSLGPRELGSYALG